MQELDVCIKSSSNNQPIFKLYHLHWYSQKIEDKIFLGIGDEFKGEYIKESSSRKMCEMVYYFLILNEY